MEKVINESLKKEKDIEKLKIKIFSKTLNINHNLKIKDFYILQIQPYLCKKHTKEKLVLLEDCITNKLFENIETYYNISDARNNLLNIINEKEINKSPNYITLENYIFEKMTKYIAQKKIIDRNLDIINKIKLQNEKIKKKKYFNINEVSNDFTNSIIDEGIKINRRPSIKKKRKEKKVVILIKTDKNTKDEKYKKIMEKRENMILINELKQSMNKINAYNYKLKIKSTNIFFLIFKKIIKKYKKDSSIEFIKRLKKIKDESNPRRTSTYQKTVILPIANKLKKSMKLNRMSLMERKSLVPRLMDLFKKNIFNTKKYKFKPVYLFSKKFNKEYNDFNSFFRDWNNNRDTKIIDDIYKYTEINFNINHNILYSQINKLIKNNKLDDLNKEVTKNKNNNVNKKRFNTISNFSNKNKIVSLKKEKMNFKDKNIFKTDNNNKLLLNLKYQL